MPQLTSDRRPDTHNVIETSKSKELGLIPAWSHSTLKTYETCPYRIYISKVKRISEDYGPAAKRGSEIHEQAEHYVQGTLGDMPDTLNKFTTQFKALKSLYDEGKVELEGVDLCRPCRHLSEVLNQDNIIKEFLRRGGLRCQILSSSSIKVGNKIKVLG